MEMELEKKVREAIDLYEGTGNGVVYDADTVLADIMENGDFRINDVGHEVLALWERCRDRDAFENLFLTLTNVTFEEYVNRCINETKTIQGGDN